MRKWLSVPLPWRWRLASFSVNTANQPTTTRNLKLKTWVLICYHKSKTLLLYTIKKSNVCFVWIQLFCTFKYGYEETRKLPQPLLTHNERNLKQKILEYKENVTSRNTKRWGTTYLLTRRKTITYLPRMSWNLGSSSMWYFSKYSNNSSVPSTLAMRTNWS